MTQLRNKMLEELQRRNYSDRTAKTYVRIIREFAKHFHQPPDKLGPEQIRQFQAYLFHTKKLSASTVSQYVSALGFLFVKTLRCHFLTEHIPFPKRPSRLPIVLSPEEVTRLINSARNLFHRVLLMTLYSTAMRRSELCHLKVTDIDSKRMMIRINQGKRRRDREVPLSPKLLEALRIYWRWMKPKTYLFPEPWTTAVPTSPLVPISCGWPVARLPKQPTSTSIFHLTRCVTVGPRICLTPGPISGPSRFYRPLPLGTHPHLLAPIPQTSASGEQSARFTGNL